MKCFKWKTAEECQSTRGPQSSQHVKCSLKHRARAEEEIEVGLDDRSATLYSSNYNRTSRPFYLRKNFCIYNISLDCPGEIVSLTSKLTNPEYGLSDKNTCEDYLWFSTSSNGDPKKICGDDIIGFSDNLLTRSFLGILWSNEKNSKGKFQIEARCTGHTISTTEPESSGYSFLQ